MKTLLLATIATIAGLPASGYAQSLFRSTSGPDTGIVFEVQRNTAAGVMVALNSQATHVYSGRVERRVSGGQAPFTTEVTVAGKMQVSTLGGAVVRQPFVELTEGVGTTTLRLVDAGTPQTFIPYGYDMATTLDDWRGYHAFMRRVSEHELDVAAFEFDAETIIDGQAALVGVSPMGSAALLFSDPHLGAIVGAFEAKSGTVVAFALLGIVNTTEEAQAVWVDTRSGGELVGPDRDLRLVRLDKPASRAKGSVAFNPAWSALAVAGGFALEQARAYQLAVPAARAAGPASVLPENE